MLTSGKWLRHAVYVKMKHKNNKCKILQCCRPVSVAWSSVTTVSEVVLVPVDVTSAAGVAWDVSRGTAVFNSSPKFTTVRRSVRGVKTRDGEFSLIWRRMAAESDKPAIIDTGRPVDNVLHPHTHTHRHKAYTLVELIMARILATCVQFRANIKLK